MKISLNWLNEFIKINQEPAKLAQDIAEHCFEVEKIIGGDSAKPKFSKVYAAKVLEWQKHPNADRLRIVKLDLGDLVVEPVVCGANNFDTGDIVALALPGAEIPQDVHTGEKIPFVLGQAKIRGIESQGMICSGFELALADKPEEKPEILLLPKDLPLGTDLAKFYSQDVKPADFVFDLALPANRPDLYSHLGIARELSGILGLKTLPALKEVQDLKKARKVLDKHAKKSAKLAEVKDKDDAPYYFAARIRVNVKDSPNFIKERFGALGLRSINNVVDITNLVMYELGQPLHAFDASKVQGPIVVRKARAGEKIETLDHKVRELNPEMLVIADQDSALAIAGIMGGLESEVTFDTHEIILEAANFSPFQIRRTSKKLGLRTDSSGFWEKGLAPEQAVLGAARAIELLQNYADAEVLETVEIGKLPNRTKKINFDIESVNGLLGSEYSAAEVKRLINRVGWKVTGAKKMIAEIPYYRSDVYNYADVADELIRITGMNLLPKQPLQVTRRTLLEDDSQLSYRIKEILAEFGLDEIQTYSFLNTNELTAEQQKSHLKIKNPLNAEQGYLRKSLASSLLKVVGNNAKQYDRVQIFEIGKGYQDYLKEEDLLGIALYDRESSPESLVALAKGLVEEVAEKIQKRQIVYKEKDNHLEIYAESQLIGTVSFATPADLKKSDLDRDVLLVELNISDLIKGLPIHTSVYQEFSRYPKKTLDISVVVGESVPVNDLINTIKASGGELLKGIDLIESAYLYPSGKLPKFHRELAEKAMKNLVFRLDFNAENRTLKDSEILPIYDKIKGELVAKNNAEIR